MAELRAVTIKQPWAWAIAHSDKRTKNRTKPVSYRGTVAIHAGLSWAGIGGVHPLIHAAMRPYLMPHQLDRPIDPAEHHGRFVFGAIIAVAELVDCHPAAGCCGPWGEPDCVHHLVLDNVRPLDEPIACRGALGLWRPNPDIVEAIQCQTL